MVDWPDVTVTLESASVVWEGGGGRRGSRSQKRLVSAEP